MKGRVLDFIAQAQGWDEAAFSDLALDLYRWQRAHNRDYDAICADARPLCWWEIPAVPVTLFRDLDLTCFPVDQAAAVFRTSGTTTGRRGVHRLLDTEAYEAGSLKWAEALFGPLPRAGVSLVSEAPDSSLGHMCHHFVPGLPGFFSLEQGVDRDGAWEALARATEPLFVPGTAFAFAELLADRDEPCPLPEGSLVMATGGFKGRRLSLSEDDVTRRLRRLLPGARLVGEYGMTELSSQLWARPLGQPFQPPPWMRVVAVDPGTGERVRRGLLRFFDLANHWTVLAIETQDVGEVSDTGEVVLHGRLAEADPRGCSLTVEEAGHG